MERLQKVIAQAGVASRRKAEEMILDGRVRVNGKVVRELGTKVGPKSEIEVDGVKIEQEEHVYYLLYKPSGYVSTVDDDKGRKVITDLVPPGARVFPVGRLDYNTTGLIILTNDGEFSNMMTHPKYKIQKRYVAKVKNIPSYLAIKQLESGVELDDGFKTGSAKVKMKSVDQKKNTAILEIVISEGHNRQIRRMVEAIGSEVIKLKREQFGFLTLDGLNTGDWRELSHKEISKLRELANPTVPPKSRGKKKKK
ncbi:MAG: rRNA pseudouridine synthase [Exiguobacterium sp.]|nr:rRNA pseudouridine synthase [Exiguobacterium sp.]MBR3215699.1 rRNA pseudouridine synthase [Exiguobacterium sp.]